MFCEMAFSFCDVPMQQTKTIYTTLEQVTQESFPISFVKIYSVVKEEVHFKDFP